MFQSEGMYWKRDWSNNTSNDLFIQNKTYLYDLYDSCSFFAHAQITGSSTKTDANDIGFENMLKLD